MTLKQSTKLFFCQHYFLNGLNLTNKKIGCVTVTIYKVSNSLQFTFIHIGCDFIQLNSLNLYLIHAFSNNNIYLIYTQFAQFLVRLGCKYFIISGYFLEHLNDSVARVMCLKCLLCLFCIW